MLLSEKTGQEQKMEVGVWSPPFYHRKATWKDYQRWYFQKLVGFLFEDKNFLETRAFHGREISWFSTNFFLNLYEITRSEKKICLFFISLIFNKPIETKFSIFVPVPCLSCRSWYYRQVVNEPDPDFCHFHSVIFSKVRGLFLKKVTFLNSLLKLC